MHYHKSLDREWSLQDDVFLERDGPKSYHHKVGWKAPGVRKWKVDHQRKTHANV